VEPEAVESAGRAVEDRLAAYRADVLAARVKAFAAQEGLVAVDAALADGRRSKAAGALEAVREADEILLAAEAELFMFRRREDHLVADKALGEVRLELLGAGRAVGKIVDRLEIGGILLAASNAAEAPLVVLPPTALDGVVLVDNFCALPATIAKARLMAARMEDKFAPSNAVVGLDLLVAQAAAEAARMPRQPGKFHIIVANGLLASGTGPGFRLAVMSEVPRNWPFHNLKFVRERKRLRTHRGILKM
jgi:hypothetical protein